MKGYQEFYSRAQHPSYRQKYIDYELHKSKLKKFYSWRREIAELVKNNDGMLNTSQFKKLTGRLDGSESDVDLGAYFRYENDAKEVEHVKLMDVDDAVLRLSLMERKGEVVLCMSKLLRLACCLWL